MHRGVFFVEGFEDTDGLDYVPASFATQYPHGLLVIQNGVAPEPEDTGDGNGFEFDGATQFLYLDVDDIKDLLRH